MSQRTVLRAASAALTLLGAQVVVVPAWAGGLGAGILSPAIGNGCANQYGATVRGTASQGASAAGGNALGLPVTGPLNQCGGADAPATKIVCTVIGENGQTLGTTSLDNAAGVLSGVLNPAATVVCQ
ncbi:hypothetical protein [Streptomyces rectiverticillatus]|uniref:hypothetical protein n=1 Tax=Streptomyces rectiverticillatus TaxID=173860 RepID=UPI0015C36001|nr:hypothetical protein [Streptomyces rectiverticillatus]